MKRPASPAPTPAAGHGIVSSADVMRKLHQTYLVVGQFARLLHEPQTNFSIMTWGKPGQGKSTLLTKFARWFAQTYGKVLYVQNEEFGSHTVQKRLSAAGGSVPGLDFAKFIPGNDVLKHYKLLILDSVNTLGITLDQFKELSAANPHLARIFVMQATKSGQFKGNNMWPHEADIEVEAHGPGKATTTKNRFGPLATFSIF